MKNFIVWALVFEIFVLSSFYMFFPSRDVATYGVSRMYYWNCSHNKDHNIYWLHNTQKALQRFRGGVSLRKKCPYSEFFRIFRIFPHSHWIWRDAMCAILQEVFSCIQNCMKCFEACNLLKDKLLYGWFVRIFCRLAFY